MTQKDLMLSGKLYKASDNSLYPDYVKTRNILIFTSY